MKDRSLLPALDAPAISLGREQRRQFARPLGLRREDFEQINENGFGDRYNGISHSSSYFDGSFFVGTSRCNLQMIAVNNPPTTRIYPVKCPDNVYDLDFNGRAVRDFLVAEVKDLLSNHLLGDEALCAVGDQVLVVEVRALGQELSQLIEHAVEPVVATRRDRH